MVEHGPDHILPVGRRSSRLLFDARLASRAIGSASPRRRAGAHGDDAPLLLLERWACEAGDLRNCACDHRSRRPQAFVLPEDRLATFDQDGTLWVEHPIYTQVVYCLDRVPAVVAEARAPGTSSRFETVPSGNREAMAELSLRDLEKILAATLTGMSVLRNSTVGGEGNGCSGPTPALEPSLHQIDVSADARGPAVSARNGFRPHIVTGGGQDFRFVSMLRQVYGIPPSRSSARPAARASVTPRNGTPFLTKEAEAPAQRQQRRQARGHPPPTARRKGCRRSGRHLRTPTLYDEAKKKDWTVISMKNDWRRVFPFRIKQQRRGHENECRETRHGAALPAVLLYRVRCGERDRRYCRHRTKACCGRSWEIAPPIPACHRTTARPPG